MSATDRLCAALAEADPAGLWDETSHAACRVLLDASGVIITASGL